MPGSGEGVGCSVALPACASPPIALSSSPPRQVTSSLDNRYPSDGFVP